MLNRQRNNHRYILVILCFLIFPGISYSQTPDNIQNTHSATERILLYKSFIKVREDASLIVTETIQVKANNQKIVHGIYRDFPTIYRGSVDKNSEPNEQHKQDTVVVPFRVLAVTKDQNKETHHISPMRNGVRIYIGSRETHLSPGIYTYSITYFTRKQLGIFKDFDELYWNVTGNDWAFPIEKAIAEVELPEGATILKSVAYTGIVGEKGQDYTSSINDKGNIVFETTKPLAPKEGFTIAVSWPKGFVDPSKYFFSSIFPWDPLDALLATIGFVVMFAYYIFVRVHTIKRIKQGTIIPLFEPPSGMSPAEVNYVYQDGDAKDLRTRGLTAAIVDMAVKGYLKIKENKKIFKKGYSLEKIHSKTEDKTGKKIEKTKEEKAPENKNDLFNNQLFEDEKILAEGFFSNQNSFDFGVLKTNRYVQRDMKDIIQKFGKKISGANKNYFKYNFLLMILGTILSALSLLIILYFNNFEGMIFYIFFFGSLLGSLFIGNIKVILWVIGIFAFFSIFSDSKDFLTNLFEIDLNNLLVLLFGTGITVILLLLFSYKKTNTESGQKIKEDIAGFKLFLSVTEEERYKMLQSPKVTTEVFEKYLPYAIALGVEKEWSKAISGVFEPLWYEGKASNVPMTTSNFSRNIGALTAAVSTASLNAMAYNQFTSSSSSSPGSFSGSGGGGSSGGGGGGGGGGGW